MSGERIKIVVWDSIGNTLLQLASEFEITPKGRGGLHELAIAWPKGIELDRRILLTSLVDSLEPTEAGFQVRLSSRQQGRCLRARSP